MDRHPLLRDRDVLPDAEVFDPRRSASSPATHHDPETFDMYIDAARHSPAPAHPLFKEMDASPPTFDGPACASIPHARVLRRHGRARGADGFTPRGGGGARLPHTIVTLANLHLMAANAGAAGFAP